MDSRKPSTALALRSAPEALQRQFASACGLPVREVVEAPVDVLADYDALCASERARKAAAEPSGMPPMLEDQAEADRVLAAMNAQVARAEANARAAKAAEPVIHARAMEYEGHAYSPWGAGHGRRQYSDRRLKSGQVELVCGLGLDDVHAVAPFSWATLQSKKSRNARLVTCPECLRRIRAVGYKYAPADTSMSPQLPPAASASPVPAVGSATAAGPGAPLTYDAVAAITADMHARRERHAALVASLLAPQTPFERALDLARECWNESGGDIEEARVLALDLCGDDADELHAVREELDAMSLRSAPEPFEARR